MFSFLCALTFSFGCKKIPEGKDAVDAFDIEGLPKGEKHDLEGGLATKATPKFLGIKRIYDYETLDELALERDLERIERELRRRGYYEAKVSAARIVRTAENRVRVEIQVVAGPPIEIRSVETTGLAQLPFEVAEAATQEMKLRVGNIFDEDKFEAAKKEMAISLANRGYAYATVSGRAEVDLAGRSAKVMLTADPGRRVKLGPLSIEGLVRLKEAPLRRILDLREGDTYSHEELEAARSALFQLGVFSRVEVIPDLDDPSKSVAPITVSVEESALRDVTLGGGVRLDLLRFAVVAQGGWTHRNFLGGLRKLSVSTRPGLNFFATSVDYLHAPVAVFPENFLTLRLEQPGFIEGHTRGFTELGYNVYPLLYPLPDDVDPRDERVIGYNEITSSLGLERGFFGRLLFGSLALNWQANVPFAYQWDPEQDALPPGDRKVDGLDTVMVGYPELITSIDLRDDPLQPTKGIYLTNSLQVALPGVGDVVDFRIRPELRTFIPLDRQHRLVLATRITVGMVFPVNYGETLTGADDATIETGAIDYSDPAVIRDQHKLLFRAFYSGGSNSNRGYPTRRIGPQGPIGFLIPEDEDCEGLDPPPTCIRPLGGFTLWETSLELRYRFSENWSVVGFMDASDVSTKLAHFSLDEPHVAVGPGLRYLSPVGPVRVDVGYRIPWLQQIRPAPNEPPDISEVPPYSDDDKWHSNFTLHILIGEAF